MNAVEEQQRKALAKYIDEAPAIPVPETDEARRVLKSIAMQVMTGNIEGAPEPVRFQMLVMVMVSMQSRVEALEAAAKGRDH